MDKIGVIDFGGQYAHLIATKLRNNGIFAEILDPEEKIETMREYKGLILSGSPALASQDEENNFNKDIFKENIPILGLCFGHQEIAKYYGGKVEHRAREYGKATLKILKDSPLFDGLSKEEIVWMSHGDTVVELPKDFDEIGVSESGGMLHHNSAISSEKIKRYGLQFHPEVDDTVNGEKILLNFATKICGIEPSWDISTFKDELIEKIKKEAKNKSVFLLVSGGVDSTVCALLLIKALGKDRVKLLHIDNGLLRKNESMEVIKYFESLGMKENFFFRDASKDFLNSLKDIIEPEAKRKIVGEVFVRVFEEEVNKLNLEDCLLAQGTIYPDTIETKGTKRADLIKTHHNRVPVIKKLIDEGKVIEPLKDLYKLEVRKLGESLGLKKELLFRHPFPGPGLSVRLLCSDGSHKENERSSIEEKVLKVVDHYKIGALVLPLKSVGVKADLRCYDYPVVLYGSLDFNKLEKIASEIYQKVFEINRVVVLLFPQPIEKIRLIKATITKERLDFLREIDYIVHSILIKNDFYYKIWQCPVCFLPLEINGKGKEFVIIRPVNSERGMTATPSYLTEKIREEILTELSQYSEISGIALDITTKPPGTIEWE